MRQISLSRSLAYQIKSRLIIHFAFVVVAPSFSQVKTSPVETTLDATQQWRSRTFGRSGRWSNLPPFRLRFCKLESLFKVAAYKSHVMSTVTLV